MQINTAGLSSVVVLDYENACTYWIHKGWCSLWLLWAFQRQRSGCWTRRCSPKPLLLQMQKTTVTISSPLLLHLTLEDVAYLRFQSYSWENSKVTQDLWGKKEASWGRFLVSKRWMLRSFEQKCEELTPAAQEVEGGLLADWGWVILTSLFIDWAGETGLYVVFGQPDMCKHTYSQFLWEVLFQIETIGLRVLLVNVPSSWSFTVFITWIISAGWDFPVGLNLE